MRGPESVWVPNGSLEPEGKLPTLIYEYSSYPRSKIPSSPTPKITFNSLVTGLFQPSYTRGQASYGPWAWSGPRNWDGVGFGSVSGAGGFAWVLERSGSDCCSGDGGSRAAVLKTPIPLACRDLRAAPTAFSTTLPRCHSWLLQGDSSFIPFPNIH